ncbi:D-alanyl-D-alanine carboxypeptidase/D-alanyl-D-alanine-endopeptidase [candidate division KSB1 bacterium]|nr:D-alanyl-D-alanine carboxypeptidase/D-alanyl-D-alanine-endopeptidase [candidate division KSB1 bacterium]
MIRKCVVAAITISILSSGCAPRYIKQHPPVHSASEKLAYQMDLLVETPEIQTATVGILVQSLDTGEIMYQHNAQKLLMPASNEKIPTSAVALMKFGPDFRYQTNLYTNGTVEDGILNGDLIIVGSGDPTISYRFCDDADSCVIFRDWITSLGEHHIKEIRGDLIGIDDVFDDQHIGYGWTVDNLTYYYSAEVGGLMLNENYAQVTLSVDSMGQNLDFSVFPDYGVLTFRTDLSIIDDEDEETEINIFRETNSNLVTYSGTIKPGQKITEDIAIHHPTRYFLSGLAHELARHGIAVKGELIDSDELDSTIIMHDWHLIHTHLSPPFSDVLNVLMKRSQNLYAESFVKLLGYHFGKEGSFEEGENIIRETLVRFGLEDDSYQYKDGSGLSRYNYISPAQIVKILRGMYYHQYGNIFRQSLPIAGIDGTIGYRMKGTSAEGKIFAKTGTISNVRCLSGYATTRDDETLVFSIMVNNFLCDVQVVMDLQDQICIALSSFSRN